MRFHKRQQPMIKSINSVAYLQQREASVNEILCENSYRLGAVNYFYKILSS